MVTAKGGVRRCPGDLTDAMVTPWETGAGAIDYDKLLIRFGCSRITEGP